MTDPDLVLLVDGSASGQNQVGYAVVTHHDILKSGSVPTHFSAQAAELVALAEAWKLAEGKTVTIYTDSRYASGVVHDFGALWKHRKCLRSDGEPVLHHDKVAALLHAILLPKATAVRKCQAYTNSFDLVSTGNAKADAAAHSAAKTRVTHTHTHIPSSLTAMQQFSTTEERQIWKKKGCTLQNVWYGPNDKPAHQNISLPTLLS